MRKLIVKYLSIALLVQLLSCSKAPIGKAGKEADGLTNKLIYNTQQRYWKDSKVLSWTFDDNRKHIWDRNRNLIKVSWKNIEVLRTLDSKNGVVMIDGLEVEGEKKQEYLDKAYSHWANDSYWLNPFWKYFQNGVERKVVKQKDGSDALLITHTSGGDTPGDAYLWFFDRQGMPKYWKLWVSIIPIKGFKMTWEGWVTLPNGLKISTLHKSKLKKIRITDMEVGATVEEVFQEKDPLRTLLINDRNNISEIH